jgi:hypothetical protein
MKKPNLRKLKVFGAQTYIHVPKSKRQSRGTLCERNFGWNKQKEKSYKCYILALKKVVSFKDVFIDE